MVILGWKSWTLNRCMSQRPHSPSSSHSSLQNVYFSERWKVTAKVEGGSLGWLSSAQASSSSSLVASHLLSTMQVLCRLKCPHCHRHHHHRWQRWHRWHHCHHHCNHDHLICPLLWAWITCLKYKYRPIINPKNFGAQKLKIGWDCWR